MGRSQVLYNRTKGRFRSRVQQQSNERESAESRRLEPTNRREEEEKAADDLPSQKRSNRISETDILLLAESKPRYTQEDDFGDGNKHSTFASSLDITSLETTLLTCMTMSERLKIPVHMAETLRAQDFGSLTAADSEAGTDAELVPPVASSSVRGTQQQQPLHYMSTSSATTVEEGWLPSAPSHDYQSSRKHFLNQRQQQQATKAADDSMSYSIGPNKIKTTKDGDVEVRIKPANLSITKQSADEVSRHSREYDVDRYAALEDEYEESGEDDEDSFTTATRDNTTLPLPTTIVHPSRQMMAPAVPKTRDKVAAFASKKNAPTDPPPQQSRQYPAIDPSTASEGVVEDDSMLNWLDNVTTTVGDKILDSSQLDGTLASDLGLRPSRMMPSGGKAPISAVDSVSLSSSSSLSTITRSTVLPQEVTFPQTRQTSAKPHSATTMSPPSSIPAGAGEDSLDAWLDDVIS